MAGTDNWERKDWFLAVEEFSISGLEGEGTSCLQLVDEWIYRWIPPSDAWRLFLESLRHSPRDPVRPSPWRAVRAVLKSLQDSDRERDLSALVKEMQRLGFSSGTAILDFDEDSKTELDDFLGVARECFEFRRVAEPESANDLCKDASRRLEKLGYRDAAEELVRWCDTADVHWNDLSERQQQIMWILGAKQPLQTASIERDIVSKDGVKGEAGSSKQQLADLGTMGVLKNKPGVGYFIEQWPSGYPREARKT